MNTTETQRITLPAETLAAFGGDELRARVFYEKYALRDATGVIVERTPQEMWARVAREIASVEPDAARRAIWEERFTWLLDDFRFIPGGRILHAAGQRQVGNKASPINCFVLPIADDSLEAIYQCCKEMALTYSRGGGCGIDISRLRPKGAVVHNAARASTGAVSFMETFSLVTGTIGQTGRRGALMITIRDDHPDVLDFVRIKRDLKSVRFANISVLISDAFMQAVAADGPWTLRYDNPDAGVRVERTIRARELWDELVTGARDWAEPGCLFIDNARRQGTTEYNGMQVLTTNPCGEQFLDPYSNCCLGSLNLLAFVKSSFARVLPHASVDWEALGRAAQYGVRFLDNVQTYAEPTFPLAAQRGASIRTRRIGLGITGLADMLIALGLRYDTDEAVAFVDDLMRVLKLEAYRASVELAKEKGAFRAFDAEQHLAQEFFADFPADLTADIRAFGLRNAALMTVPPVGSGAVLAGVTSGIEPVFALAYLRRSESLSQECFWVLHPLAVRYWEDHIRTPMPAQGPAFADAARAALPAFYVTAHDIDPMMRVKMQATIGQHVDNAVSSTINLPRDTSTGQVGELFRAAWRLGLKGITCYRESSREGILLTHEQASRTDQTGKLAEAVVEMVRDVLPDITSSNGGVPPERQVLAVVSELVERIQQLPRPVQLALTGEIPVLKPRPNVLPGVTLVQDAPTSNLQITVNEVGGEPFELIVHGGKSGTDILALVQALARAASIILRMDRLPSREERLRILIDQWRGIRGSRTAGFGIHRVDSEPDAIAQALERYLELRGRANAAPEAGTAPDERIAAAPSGEASDPLPAAGGTNGNICPQCRNMTLIVNEGCTKCTTCGFREC